MGSLFSVTAVIARRSKLQSSPPPSPQHLLCPTPPVLKAEQNKTEIRGGLWVRENSGVLLELEELGTGNYP